MSTPTLNIPLQLSPSEASVLLDGIQHAIDNGANAFEMTRLKSLRDKVNVALYGEAQP